MAFIKLNLGKENNIYVNAENVTVARPGVIQGGYGLFLTILPGKEVLINTGLEPIKTQDNVLAIADKIISGDDYDDVAKPLFIEKLEDYYDSLSPANQVIVKTIIDDAKDAVGLETDVFEMKTIVDEAIAEAKQELGGNT